MSPPKRRVTKKTAPLQATSNFEEDRVGPGAPALAAGVPAPPPPQIIKQDRAGPGAPALAAGDPAPPQMYEQGRAGPGAPALAAGDPAPTQTSEDDLAGPGALALSLPDLGPELSHALVDDLPPAAPQSSQFVAQTRQDDEMKVLLQTLSTPHYVMPSSAHQANNCLIDSILLSLHSLGYTCELTLPDRASICRATRQHLVAYHDASPAGYLAHEDHFAPICDYLRSLSSEELWEPTVDPAQLNLTAVVFDRFHRHQLVDINGGVTELPEAHPVNSQSAADVGSSETAVLQLYCNTLDDEHGTPWHYEWITTNPAEYENAQLRLGVLWKTYTRRAVSQVRRIGVQANPGPVAQTYPPAPFSCPVLIALSLCSLSPLTCLDGDRTLYVMDSPMPGQATASAGRTNVRLALLVQRTPKWIQVRRKGNK